MPKVSPEVLVEFGAAVKRARTLKGWTLDQLAGAIDCSSGKSFLSNVEKGKRDIGPRTVGRLIAALKLDESWIDRFLDAETSTQDEVTPSDRTADRLIELTERDTTTPPTAEGLLLALANEFAEGAADNLEQVYADLRAALEAAADLKRRAEMPSNLDGQVKATLTEVARLNDEARLDEGKAVIDRDLALLADRVAETNAARGQLLDGAIEQARAMNDADAAAGYALARLQLDAPPDLFEALRDERRRWYESGRDLGLNFDLRVSIALANMACDRADTANRRGSALNDLGMALQILGIREAGTERLQQAVEAYRAALEEWTRECVPLDWATTQNNLGNALLNIGEREAGTERLQQAVDTYRAALEEWTRECVPLDWAGTLFNLGLLALAFHAKTGDLTQLDDADRHLAAAREVFTEGSNDHMLPQCDELQAEITAARTATP